MIELYLLLLFMILGAIIAVESEDLLSAVISLGAVGFALSIIFLLLQAPDLAIVQIAVEVLTLVIMIAAIRKATRVDTTARKKRRIATYVPLLLVIVVFGILGSYVFFDLPEFGHPIFKVSNHYLAEGARETGAANTVASVILDYRAYDTLGEATVLFASVIGVLAVLRAKGRKKIDEGHDDNS